MTVIEFNGEEYKKLKSKKIYLIEKSLSYLDELCQTCDIAYNITAILDENKRKCGEFFYQGISLAVYPLEHLKKLNFEEAALVITSDYYKEYLSKIEGMVSGELKEIYVFYNYETKLELHYRKQYEDKELQNIIVFRSGPHNLEYVRGMDFADNARALFEYMLAIGLNEEYELVWFVKNPKEYDGYQTYDNVCFLPYDAAVSQDLSVSNAYYRALCLAKFLFFTDAYGFARNCRKDQVRVQLWHGCGYKMRLNDVRCEKRYEYMTVTSRLYADIHAKIFGLKKNQMLVTGCAKEDWLFWKDKTILQALEIPAAHRYIFWLPTYRFSGENAEKPRDGELNGGTGLPLFDSASELVSLNKILVSYRIALIVKIHPFQDTRAVYCKGLSNIILIDNNRMAKEDIQINQLLGMADALISDYSSAAVDYLVLDRPMGFIVDDLESYSSKRGFIFDNILDWLPGKCIFEKQGLINFIKEIALQQDTYKQKRQQLRRILHENTDDSNCRRIVEILGIRKPVSSEK